VVSCRDRVIVVAAGEIDGQFSRHSGRAVRSEGRERWRGGRGETGEGWHCVFRDRDVGEEKQHQPTSTAQARPGGS
jgi:hypothetical protein